MKNISVFKFFFYLLLVVCIFDPADKLFHLKSPLFILCFFLFLFDYLGAKKNRFPKSLIIINLFLIIIPLISIFLYFIQHLTFPLAGFDLFKSHILIVVSIFLYYYKLDAIKPFSIILLFLSLFIILVYLIVTIFPESYNLIYLWGLNYQIFLIGERSYSIDTESLWSIYFVTSPLLVIPIAYYTTKYFEKKNNSYLFLSLINVFAMFIAGTRNNMLVSLLLPLILFYKYSKNKLPILLISLSLIFLILINYAGLLKSMLSFEEASNSTKIGLIDDYRNIFSNPINLAIGQGIGSNNYWISRGKFDYITELTYLEIFRSYGLFLGFIILIIIFYPIYILFYKKRSNDSSILTAYFLYMVMAATNPIYFMSMGMLFLPIVLSMIFINYRKNSNPLITFNLS
jgi:hypothetical protein